MAEYDVNEAAVALCRALIDSRQYVLDSDWGDGQPSAAGQNAFLGLGACVHRAAGWRHKAVERAAYDLLQRLDER